MTFALAVGQDLRLSNVFKSLL